ncbi:transmembrane 7 superfamily member 3 [Calliopsis andreniformis]|uniref:transmembrane 7 superfamily member 3 n=1 Tax=Calliopsis andreniformis TaxID=337506 RepID=UPI003FCC279B
MRFMDVSRGLVAESLIVLLLAGAGLAVLKNPKIEALDDGSVLKVPLTNVGMGDAYIQQISIAPSSNITFNVTNVSSTSSFTIIQVHTYQYNVTLSYDKEHLHKVSNKSVFGSNIGLYLKNNLQVVTPMYLKNDNVHRVHALIAAIPYGPNAPIPGGCNMEFNTEIAPYANVFLKNVMVVVDVQPSSVPLSHNVKPVCDKNPVEHEIYQMYLSEQDFSLESYFVGIVNMLTVDDIKQNGRKILNSDLFSSMRRVFSAYTGIGSVYVAVATYNDYSAAYVPGFSYACSPVLYPESCDILTSTFQKFVCAGCFFLGLLSVLLGKYLLKGDMMITVLFTGTIFGYTLAVASTKEYDSGSNIAIGLGIGVLLSVAWMAIFISCSAVASLTFASNLGFFIICVIYFCSPDTFTILGHDWVFWLLFCAVIILSLSFVVCSVVIEPMTCAIYSSYMMVLSIDYLTGSSLKYIVINMIRRVTVEDYEKAIINSPMQTKDVCLIVLWTILALYRFVKQWVATSTPYIPL